MQEPVVEPPQATRRLQTWWIRAGQQCTLVPDVVMGDLVSDVRSVGIEATGKVYGVPVARLQGNSWAPIPSNGSW
jgi:hypothetical protein